MGGGADTWAGAGANTISHFHLISAKLNSAVSQPCRRVCDTLLYHVLTRQQTRVTAAPNLRVQAAVGGGEERDVSRDDSQPQPHTTPRNSEFVYSNIQTIIHVLNWPLIISLLALYRCNCSLWIFPVSILGKDAASSQNNFRRYLVSRV